MASSGAPHRTRALGGRDVSRPDALPEAELARLLDRRRGGHTRRDLERELRSSMELEQARGVANWADLVVARELAVARGRRLGWIALGSELGVMALFTTLALAGVLEWVKEHSARRVIGKLCLDLPLLSCFLLPYGLLRILRPSDRGFRRFRT